MRGATEAFEPGGAAPAPQRSEVLAATPRMRRAQRLHAFAITVVPAAGVAVAAYLAAVGGVRTVDLLLCAAMYTVSMLGITVGYHRLLAHKAFIVPGPVRALLAAAGSMAAQGSPVYWVSNHRRHHRYSDRVGDPHSPHVVGGTRVGRLRGFLHAQFEWPFTHQITNTMVYAPDLLRDPWVAGVNRRYYALVVLGLVVPAAVGGLWSVSVEGALTGLLWGGLVRLFFSYHAINAVNSVTHMFGTRPHPTAERSTNHVAVALAAFGEGWHNNHHAFPMSARFGHRVWQIDMGYWLIAALRAAGLARDVCIYKSRSPRAGETGQGADTSQQPEEAIQPSQKGHAPP
jgi:stearoyl-CoA desaturase (delta-9 desaturase)